MGAVNFLFGFGARTVSPLMINWFTDLFIATIAFVYLVLNRRLGEVRREWSESKKLILSVSLVDNFAWLAYSYSALYIPIAIASGISEGYMVVAVALGLVLNKEKLKKHQWFGLVIVLAAATILTLVTKG